MNRWRNLVVLMIPVLVSISAPRARGADVDDQARAAKKACLVGDVEKGVEILADLYMNTNDPTYIYNQARCFEQNGKNESAIPRFKEYLRKAKGLSPAEVDAIHKRIEELEGSSPKPMKAEAAPQVLQPAASAPTPPLPLPAAPPPAPETQGAAVDLTQPVQPPKPPESKPLYTRWWFWTGVGVVVAGGVVTALLLTQKSAPKSPACDIGSLCVQ